MLIWGRSGHHFGSLGAAMGSKGRPWGDQSNFFMNFNEFWVAWRSSLGGTLAPGGSLLQICCVKHESKFLDLFFSGSGRLRNLEKYCFTIVKHMFSKIQLSRSRVTFGDHFGDFWQHLGFIFVIWGGLVAVWNCNRILDDFLTFPGGGDLF